MSANVIKIKTKIKAGSINLGKGKYRDKKKPNPVLLYGIFIPIE